MRFRPCWFQQLFSDEFVDVADLARTRFERYQTNERLNRAAALFVAPLASDLDRAPLRLTA
jgi:hypothetical protein